MIPCSTESAEKHQPSFGDDFVDSLRPRKDVQSDRVQQWDGLLQSCYAVPGAELCRYVQDTNVWRVLHKPVQILSYAGLETKHANGIADRRVILGQPWNRSSMLLTPQKTAL